MLGAATRKAATDADDAVGGSELNSPKLADADGDDDAMAAQRCKGRTESYLRLIACREQVIALGTSRATRRQRSVFRR